MIREEKSVFVLEDEEDGSDFIDQGLGRDGLGNTGKNLHGHDSGGSKRKPISSDDSDIELDELNLSSSAPSPSEQKRDKVKLGDLPRIKNTKILSKITQISNLFVWIESIILIGLGAWTFQQLQELDKIVSINLSIGFICLGILLQFITLTGYCAVIRKSPSLLIAYGSVLFFVLLSQLGVGLGAYAYYDQASTRLQDKWNEASPDDQQSVQEHFGCCGYDVKCSASLLPTCEDKLLDFMKENLLTIFTSAFVCVLPEFLGIAGAFSLCYAIKRDSFRIE